MRQATKDTAMGATRPRQPWRLGRLKYAVGAALCLLLVACHQDMYNQPKATTYRPSQFFADGRSARPPVPNTVAVGQFQTDPHFFTGRTADGEYANDLPFPVTIEILEHGRSRYDSFCLPCHGILGDGQGIIAQRGPLNVPSLHQPRLQEAPVGYFYDVITNGFGIMYSYAPRMSVEDRWATAAYVRTLQLSQNATVDDVAPADRNRLEGSR